jgi:hypothetical protein
LPFRKISHTQKTFLQQTHTLLGRANQLKISCKSTIAAIEQTHKNPPNITQILQNPLKIVMRSTYENKNYLLRITLRLALPSSQGAIAATAATIIDRINFHHSPEKEEEKTQNPQS